MAQEDSQGVPARANHHLVAEEQDSGVRRGAGQNSDGNRRTNKLSEVVFGSALALAVVNAGLVVASGQVGKIKESSLLDSFAKILVCASPLAVAGHVLIKSSNEHQITNIQEDDERGQDSAQTKTEPKGEEKHQLGGSCTIQGSSPLTVPFRLKNVSMRIDHAIKEVEREDDDEDTPASTPRASTQRFPKGLDLFDVEDENSVSSLSPQSQEWGVLTSTSTKSKPEERRTATTSVNSFDGNGNGPSQSLSPGASTTTSLPTKVKGLSRHMSCNSIAGFDMTSSDIDTPLQQALSQLFKLRSFLSLIDPDALSAALVEMDELVEPRNQRSETNASLFSIIDGAQAQAQARGLTRRGSANSAPRLGSPLRHVRKRYSPNSMHIDSANQTSLNLDTCFAFDSAVSTTMQEQTPPGDVSGKANKPYLNSEQDIDSMTAAGTSSKELPSLVPRALGTSHDNGKKDGVGVGVGVGAGVAATSPGPAPGLARYDSGMSSQFDFHSHSEPELSSSGFSPLVSLDMAIEALMEPEKLMRPVLHGDNMMSPSGESHPWLGLVGATPAAAIDYNSGKTAEAASSRSSRSSRRRQYQKTLRARLDSDQLAHIQVDKSGKMTLRSPSMTSLAGLDDTSAGFPTVDRPNVKPRSWTFDAQGGVEEASSASVSSSSSSSLSSGLAPVSFKKLSRSKRAGGEKAKRKKAASSEQNNSPSANDHHDLHSKKNGNMGIVPELTTDSSTTINSTTTTTTTILHVGQLNDWNFDALVFAEQTEGRALYTLLFAIFAKYDYFDVFAIEKQKFKAFCKALEGGYIPLPYHNSVHAADVLVGMHHLLFNLEFGTFLDPLDSLSAMISAAIHDFRHPGLSNSFLVRTRHSLSITYNDQSVLEQMHLAQAFHLLASPGTDILSGLSNEQWLHFRKLTIRMVIATDLKDHFETVTKLRNFAKRGTPFVVPANKEIMLEVAIKVADIGHAGKNFDVHEKWAMRIKEEFFLQGDKERENGLPVSEFMDRKAVENERNQIGFFKCIALPLYQCVRTVHPPFADIERQGRRNLAQWQRIKARKAGAIAKPKMDVGAQSSNS